MLVLRQAGRLQGNYRLPGTTLYVTLEPCVMCAGARVHARVERLVYGAVDHKGGGVVSLFQGGQDSRLNHLLIVEGGLPAEESSTLLRDFFRQKRGAGRGKAQGEKKSRNDFSRDTVRETERCRVAERERLEIAWPGRPRPWFESHPLRQFYRKKIPQRAMVRKKMTSLLGCNPGQPFAADF